MKLLRVLIPILFVIFVATIFILPPRIIKVNSIDCETQFGDCDSYLLSKVENVKGFTLFEAKKKLAETLKSEVLVNDSQVQFNLPDSLKVFVLLKKPVFALKSTSNNSYLLVDEDGLGISIVPESNLPAVEIDGGVPNVGERVDAKTLFALSLVNNIFYLYQDKKAILEDDKLVIDLASGPTVIFPLTGDKEVLVGSLRLIISRLMQGLEQLRIDSVTEIDLRFKNPVIR